MDAGTIQYSHVCLAIPCWTDNPDDISKHLGVTPTRILEEAKYLKLVGEDMKEVIFSTWLLDSPESADLSNITARLWALANIIEPFSQRLLQLPPQYERWIDVLYHWTSTDPAIFSKRFRTPAQLLQRLGSLELTVAFEVVSSGLPSKPSADNLSLASRFHNPDFWRKVPGRSTAP